MSVAHASGKRPAGLGSSSGDGAGQQREQRAGGPRPELGQRREREVEREEHDRRRLVRPAALEHVQALDGLLGVGLAGQAVDRVGREDGDAADRDAALEGLGRRRRSAPRGHHALDPGEVGAALGAPEARPRARAPRRPAPGRPRPRRRGRRRRARRPAPPAGGRRPARRARRTAPAPARGARSRGAARPRPRRRAGWRPPRRARPRPRAGRRARSGRRARAARRWRAPPRAHPR